MVVSVDEQASVAGVEILRAGGNAVDAAVATAFALAVTWPGAGNLGGGGFWLGRDAAGQVLAIDFRERAPGAATPDLYARLEQQGMPHASLSGPMASGVPGTVAGLALAHKLGGKLSLSACLKPALRLARDGIIVTPLLYQSLVSEAARLRQLPEAARIFFPGGAPPQPGTRLRQPDLHRTLQRIAEQGADGFYRGAVAAQLSDWQRRAGGLITAADLADYQAIPREPVRFRYAGYEVLTTAPPSSGATLAAIASMAEASAPRLRDLSAESVHWIAEIEKRAFADRNRYFGDPAFVEVPLPMLLGQAHLRELLRGMREGAALPVPARPGEPPKERTQTTHFSVIDRQGGVVSVTTTLNGAFGSGEIVPGAGFFMNNEMDDFATFPGRPNLTGLVQGRANEVRGGKRMLSSMSPAIASQGGQVRLVWGTPGGSTIPTTNFQILWHVLGRGLDLAAAQEAPRFHQQDLPDRIDVEPGVPPEITARLRVLGHDLRKVPALGSVNAIQILHDGVRLGVSDPREQGAAVPEP